MISSVFLTGEAGQIIDANRRIVNVTRPVLDYGARSYLVDSYVVLVKNPPGTINQIMKVPEGTLVVIKGRLESDLEANEVLKEKGIFATCFVVVAELTECYALSKDMAGYQEFFPDKEK